MLLWYISKFSYTPVIGGISLKDGYPYKTWLVVIATGIVIYQLFIKSHNFVWSDHIDELNFRNNRSEPRLLSRAILVPDDLHPRYFKNGGVCAIELYKYHNKLADSPQDYLRQLKKSRSLNEHQFVYMNKNGIIAFLYLKDFDQYKYQLLNLVQSAPDANYNFNPKKLEDYEALDKCQKAYINNDVQEFYKDSYNRLIFREKYAIFSLYNARKDLDRLLQDPNTIIEVYLPIQENMYGAINGSIAYIDVKNSLKVGVGANFSHRNAKLQPSQPPNYVLQKNQSE